MRICFDCVYLLGSGSGHVALVHTSNNSSVGFGDGRREVWVFGMHYVYLLASVRMSAKHYVGFTSDLKAHLVRHNAGQNPSTAFARPWELASYVAFRTEAKAVAFEKYLKSGSGRTFATRHLF